MGATGPKHLAIILENPRVTARGGAESGAVQPGVDSADADLRRLAQLWANLPEAVRVGIVAMMQATGTNSKKDH